MFAQVMEGIGEESVDKECFYFHTKDRELWELTADESKSMPAAQCLRVLSQFYNVINPEKNTYFLTANYLQ